MESQKIAILITCHNRKDKTLACLNNLYISIKLVKDCYFDIYLVDDGCTDGTSECVQNEFPNVKIVKGDGNLYWNRGMNLAWKVAAKWNYDFYLWLNDDTYLFSNALCVLLHTAKITQDNSIIIAATCSKETGEVTYSGFSATGKIITPSNSLNEANTFNGNCVFIPKTVFEKVGNLDSIFHHAIGDIDYGLRARKKNIKSYVTPVLLAYCEDHDTLPTWCLKNVPLRKRILSLYSPLGNSHPYYFFRFELRHYGVIIATKHYLSIHLRLLIPSLWK